MIYVFYGCLILTISISAASISSDLFRIAEKLTSIEARLKEKIDSGDFKGMDKTDLLKWLIKDVYKDDRNALIKQLESLGEDVANNEQTN